MFHNIIVEDIILEVEDIYPLYVFSESLSYAKTYYKYFQIDGQPILWITINFKYAILVNLYGEKIISFLIGEERKKLEIEYKEISLNIWKEFFSDPLFVWIRR